MILEGKHVLPLKHVMKLIMIYYFLLNGDTIIMNRDLKLMANEMFNNDICGYIDCFKYDVNTLFC